MLTDMKLLSTEDSPTPQPSTDRPPTHRGLTVGLAWFSSRGFPPVRSLFIEPGRVYLHAPTSWSTKPWSDDPWRRLATLPVFSWGLVVYPKGFEPNAFGNNERIRAELLNTFSIFVNVHPGKRSKDKN